MKRFTLTFFLIALIVLSVVPASAHIPVSESERFVSQAIPSFDDRFERDLGVKYPSMSWTAADWIRWQTPRRYAEKGHVPGIHISWVICHNNPVMYTDPTGMVIDVSSIVGTQLYTDLINELAQISGINSANFIVDSNGYLRVGPFEHNPIGTSGFARDKLVSWINDQRVMEVHQASAVRGQNGQIEPIVKAGNVTMNNGNQGCVFDPKDYSFITWGLINTLAYGIGMDFFHEGSHAFEQTRDIDTTKSKPSKIIETQKAWNSNNKTYAHIWTNQIRNEMSLPLRWSYEPGDMFTNTGVKFIDPNGNELELTIDWKKVKQ